MCFLLVASTASITSTSKNCYLCFYQNLNDNIRVTYQKKKAVQMSRPQHQHPPQVRIGVCVCTKTLMTKSVSPTKKASGSNAAITTASAATTSKNCCLCFYQNFNDNIRVTYQKKQAVQMPL